MNLEIFEKVSLDEDCVIYASEVIDEFNLADSKFSSLWNLHPEKYHKVTLYGEEVSTPRWQQAYGKSYNFAGAKSEALPIANELTPFLEWATKNIDHRLNGLLLNWYDGQKKHYIGPHRDDTRDLLPDSPIVTISLGEERKFRMRPYDGSGFKDITVRNGNILILPWSTNLKWTHEVPAHRKYEGKRISITLRAFA